MAKTIQQKVIFKGVSAATLYRTYMDAKEHAKSIGGKASIQEKVGTRFKIYDGYITGTNLQLVKDKLIVQSWRGSNWQKQDLDSTFILRFEQKGKDGIVHMVHANLPDEHALSIKKGWDTYYWIPWKNYFSLLKSDR